MPTKWEFSTIKDHRLTVHWKGSADSPERVYEVDNGAGVHAKRSFSFGKSVNPFAYIYDSVEE